MGWRGVTVMDQRVRFIAEYLNRFFPVNELCLQFGVSRKTGYKWIKRYEEYGSEGLSDQSTRPRSCPHETDTAVIEAIVQARLKHPLGTQKASPYHLFSRSACSIDNCRYLKTSRTYYPRQEKASQNASRMPEDNHKSTN